jgi:predicted nucleotide-binding protein
MPERNDSSRQPRPNLRVSRHEAQERLSVQIQKGEELLAVPIASMAEVQRVKSEYLNWTRYNSELLHQLFDNSLFADQYNYWLIATSGPAEWEPLSEHVKDVHNDIKEKLDRLRPLAGTIELMPEPSPVAPNQSAESAQTTNEVFIVHGHDRAAREEVARFVGMIGLKPIILDEQASGGLTIIEKFEREASKVAAAIVLLTPDDYGAPVDSTTHNPRARQNVVFELGYFAGKLGRGRVCALMRDKVEIPSDYSGVIYVPLDVAGGWKLRVAKELKSAGLPVDAEKLLA